MTEIFQSGPTGRGIRAGSGYFLDIVAGIIGGTLLQVIGTGAGH
ncbi:MAG: hypothetical protein PHY05_08540 [Methanothrix sp.]|nr:hypothetical protein [Methanothrix sp.]